MRKLPQTLAGLIGVDHQKWTKWTLWTEWTCGDDPSANGKLTTTEEQQP
ncbi:MAG: hypothetical protein IKC82_05450 [Lentisphaeria bacterium]|nr:hypothetical protein [Lentisphaeria bacterium]